MTYLYFDISRLISTVISDETRDRCKLNERGHTCRKKCIAFVAVFSIILFTILLRLAFLFLVIVEDDAS